MQAYNQRVVLGLEEYLIGLDKISLISLSDIPAIKPAIRVLHTGQESKVDLGAMFTDSMPWEDGEEMIFWDEE